MRLPNGATKLRVEFGPVYIESPSYPDDLPGVWTVWDPRPVRQGARLVESGLRFAQAVALATQRQDGGDTR